MTMAEGKTFEELFSEQKAHMLPILGDALAQQMGPPPQAKRMNDDDLVARWWLVDPALVPQPSPESVAAAHQALIEQGASKEDAIRALHPYREDTYTVGVMGIENQVKEANRLAARAAKSPPAWLSQPPALTPGLPALPPAPTQPLSETAAPAPMSALPPGQAVAPAPPEAQPQRPGGY
jgi:hypothetical protein